MGPVISNEGDGVMPVKVTVAPTADTIPAWDDITDVPTLEGQDVVANPPRVYLSGPMSGYEGHNYDTFHAAAAELRGRGFEVISPAELGYKPGWDWLDYIVRDLEALKGCHGVVVLQDFDESTGANIEVLAALRMGLSLWRIPGFVGTRRADGSLDYESDDLVKIAEMEQQA